MSLWAVHEVLLDDSLRYAARVEAAGGGADVHVWRGMTYVFPSNLSNLRATREALDGMGRFLSGHLTSAGEARRAGETEARASGAR